MSILPLSGKALRMARLSRHNDGRFLFVPLDHTVADGPIASVPGFNQLVRDIVDGGADAIVVHKGRARTIAPHLLARCALVVHLSASTMHAPDANAKVLVGEVAEAVRLGADAVSVHVNVGSATEAGQLADCAAVARECDRWGIPLIAMMYPRGPRITDPSDPVLVSHVANIAADLGADIVKVPMVAPIHAMVEVVAASPLPIVVAGGAGQQSAADFATSALEVGCRGLAVGRRVFTSVEPRKTVRELARIVHQSEFGSAPVSQPRMAGIS
ncbi:2-amino-3,7-dideoxy-D-threo-hept-6-ulosonate synthase [Lentzea sp. NPDC051838]|uniref:2-amino-3,7-dideoxy-D-threo-hept-6-ulosonate synthase n=1 Tax=Lentzea sp. NPDC051838 TaxID=3154849 RepID=UPI0034268334